MHAFVAFSFSRMHIRALLATTAFMQREQLLLHLRVENVS
jgi:hypothetical protein